MKLVRLYGVLGREFGKRHYLDIRSPSEAIRALKANFKDFEKRLIELGNAGLKYCVRTDNNTIGGEQAAYPVHKTISIIPIVVGAKSAAMKQIMTAAAIIALAIITSGTSLGAQAIGATTVSGMLMTIGVAMAIGGVIQLLSPTAKLDDKSGENKKSYQFNGPVNVTDQGGPVPVGYGRLIVGSTVVSAGMVSEELAP